MASKLISGLLAYLGKGKRIRTMIDRNKKILSSLPEDPTATIARIVSTQKSYRDIGAAFDPLERRIHALSTMGRTRLTEGTAEELNKLYQEAVDASKRVVHGSQPLPDLTRRFKPGRMTFFDYQAPSNAVSVLRKSNAMGLYDGTSQGARAEIAKLRDAAAHVGAANGRIDSLRRALRRYYLTNAVTAVGTAGAGGAGVVAYNRTKKD